MGEDIEIPEEFIDFVSQELAYDPVSLTLTCDPTQSLFDRTTLEKIWETKQTATHPLTRQAFDVKDIVPRPDVRSRIRDILKESDTDYRVIRDYESPIDSDSFTLLISKIQTYSAQLSSCEEGSNIKETKYAKSLWRKLNFFRLQIERHPSVRILHRDSNSPGILLRVIDDNFIGEHISLEGDMMEIARELAKIHYQVGFDEKTPLEASHTSIRALGSLLESLCKVSYSKIQSRALAVLRKLLQCERFLDTRLLYYPLRCTNIMNSIMLVLSRKNKREMTDRDMANGTQLVKKLWHRHPNLVIAFSPCIVAVLADVATLCVSRLRTSKRMSAQKALCRCLHVITHCSQCSDGKRLRHELLTHMRFIDTVYDVFSLFHDDRSGIGEHHLHYCMSVALFLLSDNAEEAERAATNTWFLRLFENGVRKTFNPEMQEYIQMLEDLIMH